MRQAIPRLHTSILRGVWRLVRRAGLQRRTAQGQQPRPHPDYAAKEASLRALKPSVVKVHRFAADWPERRRHVKAFVDQCAEGSSTRLQDVG